MVRHAVGLRPQHKAGDIPDSASRACLNELIESRKAARNFVREVGLPVPKGPAKWQLIFKEMGKFCPTPVMEMPIAPIHGSKEPSMNWRCNILHHSVERGRRVVRQDRAQRGCDQGLGLYPTCGCSSFGVGEAVASAQATMGVGHERVPVSSGSSPHHDCQRHLDRGDYKKKHFTTDQKHVFWASAECGLKGGYMFSNHGLPQGPVGGASNQWIKDLPRMMSGWRGNQGLKMIHQVARLLDQTSSLVGQ